MITAAVNRLRSFCSSVSISRCTGLVSLQVEKEQFNDISASRYWDRIDRPEQLPASLMKSIQILTDPATTGGGVVYSSASRVLAEFAEKTGIPIGSTQAGKGALPNDHPMNSGPMGALGLRFANRLAHTADLIIGVGTHYTDFISATNTMFQNPQVYFVNINVLSFDAHKEAAIPVIGDASFIMYHQDVLTAIQEREKIILLLLDNGGYGSIHSLSMQVGSQGFETKYYYRGDNGRQNLKEPLQVDFPKILEGYGVETYTVEDADQLRQALRKALASDQITAIYAKVAPVERDDAADAYWEVGTPEVAHIESSIKAHQEYERIRDLQRNYL